MHICFLCNEYPPGQHGGVGSFTQTLGRALVGKGHQVTALGIYPIERAAIEDDQGVRVVRLRHSRVPRTGFLINGLRIRQTLNEIRQQRNIDVLEGPELSLAVIPGRFPAAKVIRMHGGHHFFFTTLGSKPRLWRSWLEEQSFGKVDSLCAVSRFVAETTRDLLRLGNRAIEVLPNPVDASLFGPRPCELIQDGLIVFVGTVCEKKGIRQLVDAMPPIVDAVPAAQLWVVGRDWRDPQTGRSFTDALRRSIPAPLESRITFKGEVDHAALPGILGKAAVCVYPSHMEALPVAWLEAMACGKAVVASKTGPGSEVIEDGISGLLCDPHSPKSIAEKVIQVLKDPALRCRLGKQARQRVVDRFSVEALVERNEEFYRRCIHAKTGA